MRAGMVIEFEGQRYTILKQNIMIPGKGGAFIQVDMRNIKTGRKKNQRWRTADTVERLHHRGQGVHLLLSRWRQLAFMEPETYEQIALPKDILGDRRPSCRGHMTVRSA